MAATSTPLAVPPRAEHELIPYRALAPLGLRSLTVLAPHPDDEVFGCGGLLALAVQQHVPVRVVVVSDGAAGGEAAVRERECEAAAAALGYAGPADVLRFWRLPDRGVVADDALVERIRLLCGDGPDHWLVAPSPFEIHPDHRAVCAAATAAAAPTAAQLVYYEVGQPLMPNLLVDISAVTPHKRDAMRCFASQLVQQDYGEHITALNRYRSYTLGPAVTHAEAFWRVPAGASLEDVFGEARVQLGRRF